MPGTDVATRLITVRLRRRLVMVTVAVALAVLAVACAHTAVATDAVGGTLLDRRNWLWEPVLAIVAGQTVLFCLARPYAARADELAAVEALDVAVLVPVYNEDPGYLRVALEALAGQSRRPGSVHVVDDGSTVDYARVRSWWTGAARDAGITATWDRTPNAGKRSAQVTAARRCPDADILVTVDSDAQLAPNALEELLQPFADARVQAVAGLVVAHNNRPGVLPRLTDLWYVTAQLVDRTALSVVRSVMVTSGSLAAYRAPVLRDNVASYLGETFRGRPVTFSDDSMLTLYALMRGQVVQQISAVVFTAMPETVSHHLRQYVRWMRGSTIRSLWRARYLPLTHPAYLAQLLRWFQQTAYLAALGWLLAAHLGGTAPFAPVIVGVPLLITFSQTLRYLTLCRSDEPLRSQLLTWTLTPLALLWSWLVLRPVRWYAVLTCGRTGWGTRAAGPEVALQPGG